MILKTTYFISWYPCLKKGNFLFFFLSSKWAFAFENSLWVCVMSLLKSWHIFLFSEEFLGKIFSKHTDPPHNGKSFKCNHWKKRGSRKFEFFIYMMYQFTDCLRLHNIASSSGHRVQVSSLLQWLFTFPNFYIILKYILFATIKKRKIGEYSNVVI